MSQLRFGSAGVTAKEIDLSSPTTQQPAGVPAGIIGTALRGPAFVPITIGSVSDFYAKFGKSDGKKFGPLAVTEWLRNARSATYMRVLGCGDGKNRVADGNLAGTVTSAGFVVGEELPMGDLGYISPNTYSNSGGPLGRTYFLGTLMSESAGSTVFSQANAQNSAAAIPIIRAVVLAPSGVILRISASNADSAAPTSTLVAADATAKGWLTGAVNLSSGKQEFTLLLNGHKGTESLYPNVITASFDVTAPNYIANVFNTDPAKLNRAGHYLYAHWDVYPVTAVVTGTSVVPAALSAGVTGGAESCAFLTTGALGRNVGSDTVPNYENFEDRFSHAKSPWITSQKFGGVNYNLFRLHALDDGSGISDKYKFSIENIATSTDPSNLYGTFDLVIRDINDRDTSPRVVESFRGLTIDPSSDRYIARVVGDAHGYYDFDRTESEQKLAIDGQYENQSNLVRVEMDESVDSANVDSTALPFGIRGAYHLVTSGSAPLAAPGAGSWMKSAITPPLPMRKDITQGSGAKVQVQPQYYWGYQFEHVTSLDTQNGSSMQNKTLLTHTKFFPTHMTNVVNFATGDNEGEVDTAANGVIDADRFNLNAFSLENVKVVTGSAGTADPSRWSSAVYVRGGNITADESAKTRKLTTADLTQANKKYVKFSFFMQGGFDGTNMFDRDETELNNNAVMADMDGAAGRGLNNGPNVKTYMKALDIMADTMAADIQVLAIPGIREAIVTNYALDKVTERFDSLYLMDIEEWDVDGNRVLSGSQRVSVSETSRQFASRALNNSFGAAYFPDVLMTDPNTNTNLFVPPSVQVLGALALNDAVGHPWFAPAGFTRGALTSALEAKVSLSKENLDDLYDVDVNPITSFPGNASSGTNPKGGVVVWGQKTLLATASALDRVNVRRLLIDLRRQVRDIARTFIFEPNREATLARFTAAVTPRLQRIQQLSGIERYRVVFDASTTTQQDIENNTIRGKITVQPTKTVEFVSLDFVVSNDL